MAKKQFQLCAGTVEIEAFDTPEEIGQEILVEVYQLGLCLQKVFDFFDPSSELSQLNTKRNARVSGELLEVIKKGIEYGELTAGNFDISKGKQFLARKKGKELPQLGCSFRDITINGQEVSLKHPDVLIDLGSIAKSYIVDKMVEKMEDLGVSSGVVDARGDIRVFGETAEEIEVQHPRDLSSGVGRMRLCAGAVATSGDYKQFFGGFDKSHIIGQKELASVSVVASSAMEANALSTSIFVMGWERGQDLLSMANGTKALCIDTDCRVFSHNWKGETLGDLQ